MATLKELMQEVVNYSFEERVSRARLYYGDALKIIRSKISLPSNVSPTDFICMLIGTAICVDGTFTPGEKAMVASLGLDVEDMFEWGQGAIDNDFLPTLDAIVDDLNNNDKCTLVLLCLYIMAADGTLTVSEQNVICKLLA